MANISTFWEKWSPYLSEIEDNHLDLFTLKQLENSLLDPILIVGAGQGLLVEELRKVGLRADGVDFCPEMVSYAQKRRGLKLIQANAVALPFADESYKTVIVATGVIDFVDDEELIRGIINETSRVTQSTGRLFIAFYKVHPAAERFLRRIGIISENGTMRHRQIFELSRQDPFSFIASVRKKGNLGVVGALFELLRMHFFLPKQERIMTSNLARILTTADNADELIDAVSESIPYRDKDHIQALFRRLRVPVNELMVFDPCIVVDVGRRV